MRKILSIILMVFLFYCVEFALFSIFGSWFKPDLLIILIVFVTLFLGIRYGILTAFLAGVLRDSMGTFVFGVNIVSLTFCVYMTTLLHKYIYVRGSRSSRLIIVFLICIINNCAHYVLFSIFTRVAISDAIKYVVLPEMIATLVVTTYTLNILKRCASKLFV